MSRKKRRFLLWLGAILLAYFGWVGWQTVRFKTYPAAAGAAAPAAEPGLPGYEIQGVYHIHSRYSDGFRTVQAIVSLASQAGLDFIIFTEHGKPNYPSLASQGWSKSLLVLAGSELSVNRGHMVALGFRKPAASFSQTTEIAAEEIAALGGFSIVAHPYSKTRWSWGAAVPFAGIEIIDEDTMFRKNIAKSLLYLPALLVNARLALLRIIAPLPQPLRKWDDLNGRGQNRLFGYFSADVHYLYRSVLPIFHLHVQLEAPLAREFEAARNQVWEALRKGHFYSAVDGAAAARGFNFWAELADEKIPMGSELNTMAGPDEAAKAAKFHVSAPFSLPCETRLIGNGRIVFRSEAKDVIFETKDPGVYRAEVHLKARSPLHPDVPWILSNPIFFNIPLRKEHR